MEYLTLSERLRKTLYYGILPKQDRPSLALTTVIMEKFGESGSNSLFLEKLCFDYAAELSREACVSPCSLVLALIYLERLMKTNPNFISSIPSSRLFLISVMIASKFLNDEGGEDEVFNDEWANCAKIDLVQLNQLERDFLTAIDWSLYVDTEEFSSKLEDIEFRVARAETLKRGWMTYTDMSILGQSRLLVETWELMVSHVISVSLACTTAYVASFFTLVGSALVVSSLPWNSSPAPQLSSNISVNADHGIATAGQPLFDIGTFRSRSNESTLSVSVADTEADPEALLPHLSHFNMLAERVNEALLTPENLSFPNFLSQILSVTEAPPYCRGPDWWCRPTSVITYLPLTSRKEATDPGNSTASKGDPQPLCSQMYSVFGVAQNPFSSVASCVLV